MYLLPHILDRSAARYPDHPAFRCRDAALSYAALHRAATGLARVLVAEGVRRGDRVGIFLDKSLESAIAIYGTWLAGAAYVPIDPRSPLARLAFVLQDCDVRHVVSQPDKQALLAQAAATTPLACAIGLPGDAGTAELRVRTWEEVDAEAGGPAPAGARVEDDLAYVMYTSGSTGTPKGLMHTHRSGLGYARLAATLYGVTHADRLSNHSPLHFDMSTFDYFSGPLAGATTVVIREDAARLPASLSALVERERLTIWYSVPFALVQLHLHGALETRDLSSLRWVLFGGEPFPSRHLRALMARWPHARFSNVYGPAEVNQCTFHHLEAPPADGADVPIGRAWDNTETLVLGEDDVPVSAGRPGELVVRTVTMMRGYWGRPDLDARAFHRRPVHGHHADVFYRTGDLVVEDEAGALHFLGRRDRQVKVRGHRVELDEVELQLTAHPEVDEAAVFAVDAGDDERRIEAAARIKPGATITVRDLRTHLASRLPAYALPAAIHLPAAFPRTSTGKIDRRALAEAAAGGTSTT